EKGSLDLKRENAGEEGGFPASVAIYDQESYELLGLAHFRVSDHVFLELARDVRHGLGNVSLAVCALLVVLWAVLVVLLGKLQRQTLERDRAERELGEQERRYERLVNSLSTYFVYRKDRTGRLLSVSDSVRNVLGFSPAEFRQRFADALSSPAARDAAPGT